MEHKSYVQLANDVKCQGTTGIFILSKWLKARWNWIPINIPSKLLTSVPPGLSHFFAWRNVSSMRSLKSMYPMGSEMMTSTCSGTSTSSILPAMTNTRSDNRLLFTSVWNMIHTKPQTIKQTCSICYQLSENRQHLFKFSCLSSSKLSDEKRCHYITHSIMV